MLLERSVPIQYLLDEHMPLAHRTQLLSRAPSLTLWKIGMPGVPPSGTLDPEILLWCEANDFILVTNNRKSIPVHLADHLAAGRHIPGILTVDIPAIWLGTSMIYCWSPLPLSPASTKTASYTCRSEARTVRAACPAI